MISVDSNGMQNISVESVWNDSEEKELLMHTIHVYPAKFPAFIATKAFEYAENEGVQVGKTADIFCGCGTVALEAKVHGKDFWGCDINPVATLIAKTKSTSYDLALFHQYYESVKKRYQNPLDRTQMKKIKYDRNGIISTFPKDENMEYDINHVLHLNGLINETDGRTIADTSFSLVKGRKEVYDNYICYIKGLAKRGKLNKAVLRHKVRQLETSAIYVNYAGVWLFFLKRKIRECC